MSNFSQKSAGRRGFTIIELLVVISIIGLLASIVLAGLNGARQRAAVISIVSNLKAVEKAFLMLGYDQDWQTWRLECDFVGGCPPANNPNPNISLLVTDAANLGRFLTAAPTLPIGINMGYDNDDNTFACGGSVTNGVNIHIRQVPQAIAEQVSLIIDGSTDINCGRIRWFEDSGLRTLFYSLSDVQQF